MPRAGKKRSWRVAVLLAALVVGAVAAAEASIPPPESWPSLGEEPAASVLEPPSLDDLAAELEPPATSPAPAAEAAAGQPFRLFEGLDELGLAARSQPRFRLYPRLETRVRAITLPEPLHIELELPLTPSRFRLYGDPGSRIAVGGTFITTDPLGYVDGPNLYQYGLNNPINYSDPMGLCVLGLPCPKSVQYAVDVYTGYILENTKDVLELGQGTSDMVTRGESARVREGVRAFATTEGTLSQRIAAGLYTGERAATAVRTLDTLSHVKPPEAARGTSRRQSRCRC